MEQDISHLICEKHKEEKNYCHIDRKWECISCKLEDK